MNNLADWFFSTFFLIWWIAGIILAKGVWSTIAAFIFPPWALYLVVEKIMILNGWIQIDWIPVGK